MEQDDFISTSASTISESAPADTKEPATKSAPSQYEGGTTEESGTSEETQEASETQESEESQGSDDLEAQAKPKKKGGFEKRIERFQKQIAEREQRIAALEAQINGKSQQEKPEEKAKASGAGEEPNPNDFDTNAEYIKALTKWELKLEKEAAKAEADKASAAEKTRKLQSDYTSKLEEFKKTAPDFDEVVSDFSEQYGEFNASPVIIEALMSSDLGPHIFYEVIKNPSEYERLSKMSEINVIRELGKIEARLSKSSVEEKTQITTSKAPAPVKPIASGVSKTRKSLEDMSVDEFLEVRNAKQRR